MIKRVREEKGGFTLAELLIVVAIILVLVAVAVPVFTGALNDANKAVQNSNTSTVKAVASNTYMFAEYNKADTGKTAAQGVYVVDKKGNLYKPGEAEPEKTEVEGYYKVEITDPDDKAENGINDVKIVVTRTDDKPQG